MTAVPACPAGTVTVAVVGDSQVAPPAVAPFTCVVIPDLTKSAAEAPNPVPVTVTVPPVGATIAGLSDAASTVHV